MRHVFALLALTALTAEGLPAMTQTPSDASQALSLEVRQEDGKIAVALTGHSARALEVSYLLEISGKSNSRHRGRTTLAANVPARLSTMMVDAGEKWCVRLLAEEAGKAPYEIREGDCPEDGD